MNGVLRAFRDGDLIDAVEELCVEAEATSGWVRGFGTAEDVRVEVGSGEVHFDEAMIGSMDGSVARIGDRVSVRLAVVITSTAAGVPVTVSGYLLSARCADVEVALLPFGAEATRVAVSGGVPRLEVSGAGSPVHSARGVARAAERPNDMPTRPVAAAPSALRTAEREGSSGQPRPSEGRASVPSVASAERSGGGPSRPASGAAGLAERARGGAPQPAAEAPRPAVDSPRPAAEAPRPVASAGDWAAVAAASAKVSAGDWEEDGEVDVDELERGDTLRHPALDVCTVVGVISDDAVKVRLPNGSVRKLVMRGFRLFREGDNAFRIEKK